MRVIAIGVRQVGLEDVMRMADELPVHLRRDLTHEPRYPWQCPNQSRLLGLDPLGGERVPLVDMRVDDAVGPGREHDGSLSILGPWNRTAFRPKSYFPVRSTGSLTICRTHRGPT